MNMDVKTCIDEIKLVLDEFFPERVSFSNKAGLTYILDGSSDALNRFDEHEIVRVHPLFDDFWIHINLTFRREEKWKRTSSFQPFMSVSFFYGKADDPEKTQLFRAEWDSYQNGNVHPQPHWHITSNQSIERTFKDIADSISDEGDIFIDMLKEEKRVGLNIEKMHFAMSGKWTTDGNLVQDMDSPETLALWLKNLIYHVKDELKYIS